MSSKRHRNWRQKHVTQGNPYPVSSAFQGHPSWLAVNLTSGSLSAAGDLSRSGNDESHLPLVTTRGTLLNLGKHSWSRCLVIHPALVCPCEDRKKLFFSHLWSGFIMLIMVLEGLKKRETLMVHEGVKGKRLFCDSLTLVPIKTQWMCHSKRSATN